ncbi:RAMP superfamily CRISPR-associated protein [Limnoraphis robusta]|uniref:RAMP superfamily CRISPR-associated protein n=1 Tax=Limnoraphis robusta CCNP1315 TaxID=3110306 RepID=A0ABU5TV85_9CYAN|nr:RAMP superfamily CRISPR-associated protein [Limnoraphis robusta]MEA5518816.1 RAMP superfamily CRISPR-associated protein [Limnoraphis robusta CCNP1315]MEA5548699.1 RAMP superfamily CRISPR-associated protein [Limnoraphis robusta CCNP1324]
MYSKGYGIIETLAPLQVGATAGEETGNLNLIYRDQFTQTGIVPGSSIRGRLRADMFARTGDKNQTDDWYGRASEKNRQENHFYESVIKIEYASIVWLPVFCPGQPIVWVSCPRLLERYQRIIGCEEKAPDPYTSSKTLKARKLKKPKGEDKEVLFFNLGFLTIKTPNKDLSSWFPGEEKQYPAVVVDNNDMGMIHDMALYRQSRVALEPGEKVASNKAFFNEEALPEGTILIFPIAIKYRPEKDWKDWHPLEKDKEGDIYLGGLESIGFGHCSVKIKKLEEEK